MARKRKPYSRSVYQSISLIMQFGIYMIVPIAGMSVAGYFLDRWAGTKWIIIVCFFVGAIAGFQNVYRLAMKIAKAPKEEEEVTVLNPKGGAVEKDAGVAEEEK